MWTFEVCHLDLILYIIYFLCGMCAQTSSNFPLWLPFGSCLCDFAWCGFSLISISIYYVRNHLFHFILTMALPVGSNNWNYQQTFFNMAFKFLPLAICFLLWSWSWSSFLYTTERYLYILLVLTSDTSNCGGLCRPSSHWLLR